MQDMNENAKRWKKERGRMLFIWFSEGGSCPRRGAESPLHTLNSYLYPGQRPALDSVVTVAISIFEDRTILQ